MGIVGVARMDDTTLDGSRLGLIRDGRTVFPPTTELRIEDGTRLAGIWVGNARRDETLAITDG